MTAPHPAPTVDLAGPWQQARPGLFVISGPAPLDAEALHHWLDRGCRGAVPVRQGFAAALLRADGSAVVASSSRWEQSVLHAAAAGRTVVGIHAADVIRRLPQPPALDLAKLADLVALYDDAEHTVYEGIRRLPFGSALHLSPTGTARVERWWQPSTEEDHSLRPADAPELVRAAVRSAVAASLPTTGDVTATLSGGLDSSIVAAAAAAALAPDGRGLLALTHRPIPGAGTEDPVGTWEADDGPYAELLARTTPGVRWESVVNDARVTPLDAVEWMIGRTWQPPFNPINQVWVNAMVRRTEEQGSPLLLTGSAGNATFSRDSAGIVRGLVRERRLGAVLRQARARHHAGSSWPDAVRSVGREGAPERLLAWARARRGIASRQDHPLSTADLPVRRERISAAAVARLDLVEGRIPPTRGGWIDFALTDQSRIGTAQNLSPTVWWSDPLSDPEVVALALRLPEEAWIANGWDRGLARAAGAGLVPEAVLWRRTRGAQAADVAAWVAGTEPAYRSLLERLRASASVAEFLDLDALERAIGAGLADPVVAPWWQNVYGRAFALGRFALWYEEEVLRPA